MYNSKWQTLTFLLGCLFLLSACGVAPQKLSVEPELNFIALKGTDSPIQVMVIDKRDNAELLGYRNAKKEGAITFSKPLAQSLQSQIEEALRAQSIWVDKTPEPQIQLTIEVVDLSYVAPHETWVSSIKMKGAIIVNVQRSKSNLTKRFTANQNQDVVTAPTAEFNEDYMNTLLTALINKAMNDKEVAGFIR